MKPCNHRGQSIRKAFCRSVHAPVSVYQCELHGECTPSAHDVYAVEKNATSRFVAFCRNCEDYIPDSNAPDESFELHPPAQRPTCVYGRDLSRTVEVKSCCGSSTTQVPVYRCHIYGECTERDHDIRRQLVIGKETIALESKVQPCEGCEFFEAKGGLQEPKPKKSEAETDSPEPGLLKAAGNFVKSATKHVASGMPKVSDEERQRRIEMCEGCEFLNAKRQKCKKCGCFVRVKAKWAKEECPVGKW